VVFDGVAKATLSADEDNLPRVCQVDVMTQSGRLRAAGSRQWK